MITFRKFLEDDMSAAPTLGAAPSSPDAPNKKFDVSVGDREMDISPEERDTIDVDGAFITSFEPFTIPGHGIKASAPITLQILKKYPDGSAEVKVMYSLANRQKLQTLNGTRYEGPVKDQNTHMSKQTLDHIRLRPLDNQAGSAGGVPPAPGGPPGMPAAPPMGM